MDNKKPNIQNVPIRTSLGGVIRQAFTPIEVKRGLITIDYSRIELRIWAHFTSNGSKGQS